MDVNALMGAAAQDPKLAAFFQQLLSGGAGQGGGQSLLEAIHPQAVQGGGSPPAPGGGAGVSSYDQAASVMDELLGKGKTGGTPGQPAGAGQGIIPPAAQQVAPTATPGGGEIAPASQGPLQPQPPIDPSQIPGENPQGLLDLLAQIGGTLGLGSRPTG